MTQVLTNVIYAPKIENNTIKIGHFIHKCKFSTFIIIDGYRFMTVEKILEIKTKKRVIVIIFDI